MKMKKRCKYCNGIVKIKKEEIKNIEGKGRGVLCDLCGAFISIPKKIDGNVRLSNRGHIGRSWKSNNYMRKKRRQKTAFLIVSIIGLFVLTCYFFNNNFIYPRPVNNEQPYSDFLLICNSTGMDMSTEIKISILEPKIGIEFEDENDIRNHSNYQILIDSEFPVDIIIDLRSFDYILAEVNTNNYPNYTHYYQIIYGGNNYNYVLWAKYIGD